MWKEIIWEIMQQNYNHWVYSRNRNIRSQTLMSWDFHRLWKYWCQFIMSGRTILWSLCSKVLVVLPKPQSLGHKIVRLKSHPITEQTDKWKHLMPVILHKTQRIRTGYFTVCVAFGCFFLCEAGKWIIYHLLQLQNRFSVVI